MRSLAALAIILAAPVSASADGAADFARCAACHLPSGAGVPGAFPPFAADFRSLTAEPDGRRYLALVVTRGAAGSITVDGKPYHGVMPAQSSLDDGAVAAVLNYIARSIAVAGPKFKSFSTGEIAATRPVGLTMTSAQVADLHAKAGGK